MVSSIILVLTTALAGFVSAQSTPFNLTQMFDITKANETDYSNWCQGQENTCRSACGGPGEVGTNDCQVDSTSFSATCTCANATDTPVDISQYSDSLAAKVCQAGFGQCIEMYQSQAQQQFECEQARMGCGDATIDDPAQVSSSASSSATPGPTSSGSNEPPTETGSEPAPTTGAAIAAYAVEYSTPALAAGMMALFGMVL